MGDQEVFRPTRDATILLGFLVLFVLAIIVFGVALLIAGGVLGALGGAVFILIGLPLARFPVTLLRGWFALEVGSEGLSLVGLFGLWRFELWWNDLEAVGTLDWQGTRVLGVRPARPENFRSSSRALHWDPDRALMLISGVERWSRPSDELCGALRAHSGDKWSDPLSEPILDDR